MKNLYKLLLTLIVAAACQPPVDTKDIESDTYYHEELGQTGQELGAHNRGGWDSATWKHAKCNMTDQTRECVYPAPRTDGLGAYRRLITAPITSISTLGADIGDAVTYARAYIEFSTGPWTFVDSTQASAANVVIVGEDIYNGTPPNANLATDAIMHVFCSAFGFDLIPIEPAYDADVFACKQVTIAIDVASFSAWLSHWTTTVAQRQTNWNSLLLHGLTVASTGVGSTTAGDTAMRQTLSRAQTPVTLTSWELCLANSLNYSVALAPDPSMIVYNNCN